MCNGNGNGSDASLTPGRDSFDVIRRTIERISFLRRRAAKARSRFCAAAANRPARPQVFRPGKVEEAVRKIRSGVLDSGEVIDLTVLRLCEREFPGCPVCNHVMNRTSGQNFECPNCGETLTTAGRIAC